MRCKHKKQTILIAILLCSLTLQLYLAKTKADNPIVSGSNFTVYFPSISSLAFQNDIDRTITLTTTSGILNGTSGQLSMAENSGTLQFFSLDNAVIKVEYTLIDGNVQVNGDQNKTAHRLESGESFTIELGNTITLSWVTPLQPLLPYIFILGMIGLLCTFAGPIYGIYQVKHQEYYEGFRTGLVITVLGVALTIAWLWSV